MPPASVELHCAALLACMHADAFVLECRQTAAVTQTTFVINEAVERRTADAPS